MNQQAVKKNVIDKILKALENYNGTHTYQARLIILPFRDYYEFVDHCFSMGLSETKYLGAVVAWDYFADEIILKPFPHEYEDEPEIKATDKEAWFMKGTDKTHRVVQYSKSPERYSCNCGLYMKKKNCHHIKTIKLRKTMGTIDKTFALESGVREFSINYDEEVISTNVDKRNYFVRALKWNFNKEVAKLLFYLLIYGWSPAEIKKEFDLKIGGDALFDLLVQQFITDNQALLYIQEN